MPSKRRARAIPRSIVPTCPKCGAPYCLELPCHQRLVEFAEAAAGIIAWAKDHGARNTAVLERMRRRALRQARRR